MTAHYFAFGSNMSSTRLRERIASAVVVSPGHLSGWRWALNKTGGDGSAKANIEPDPTSTVWGVIYRLPLIELPRLDAIEGGYERQRVEVVTASRAVLCETYASTRISEAMTAADWYLEHIVSGAEEHGLPDDWVAMLRALTARRRG